MDATEISGLESELMDFLGEFDDCFGRSEPRERLATYMRGQLSDLPRCYSPRHSGLFCTKFWRAPKWIR